MTGVGTHKHNVKGRNTGSRKIRRTKIDGQFAARLIRMLEAPAYRVLSLSARRVIDRIEIELAKHGGADNGKLPVTFDDFARYGIERHAIAPAMREAVALGFIEITEHGRAGNADWRKPNVFRLTCRHTDYAGPTNDWENIETDERAFAIAQVARRATTSPPKTFSQCGKKPILGVGNPHRKRPNHSGETHTTGHSGETHTTSIFSGGERRRAA
jgi:hypothetical protein